MNFQNKRWARVFNIFASLIVASIVLTEAQTPNILFLFSDDHAYQAIGAYDSHLKAYTRTPNLDKLASEGMRFERAYVTNSICGPSRAVIQTGKYSHINGFLQNGNSFNGNQQTFPKIMQANGYETAVIGKWHLGTEPQGYDYYEVYPGQGRYFQPQYYQNGDHGGARPSFPGNAPDVTGDKAVNWLENTRNKTKPFMLMVQFKATHRTWMPATRYLNDYMGDSIPEPSNLFDDFDNYPYRGSASFYSNMSLGTGNLGAFLDGGYDDKRFFTHGIFNPLTTAQLDSMRAAYGPGNTAFDLLTTDREKRQWWYQRYIKDFLRTGQGIDHNVGKVLQYVKDNNLEQNTIVIYSSDQGFYLGEHGWFDKRFMYEQSLRTPLIVKWPGVTTPGTVNDTDIVSNVDYAETFLDLAGMTVPTDMQGYSIKPLLQGNTPADWRKSFYYQYYEGGGHGVYRHYGVTTGRYKLIYFHDIDEWEFYDLKKDPDEMINQYYIPENDSIIIAMKAELTQLRTDLNVPASTGSGPSQTRNFLRYTDYLPLTGCGNPAYVEYDAEVDDPDASYCKTLVPIIDRKNFSFGIMVDNNIHSDHLVLSFDRILQNKRIKVFNMMGKEIFSNKINGNKILIPKRLLQTGLHFIQIENEGLKLVKKILI